jgi:hypothetical protein
MSLDKKSNIRPIIYVFPSSGAGYCEAASKEHNGHAPMYIATFTPVCKLFIRQNSQGLSGTRQTRFRSVIPSNRSKVFFSLLRVAFRLTNASALTIDLGQRISQCRPFPGRAREGHRAGSSLIILKGNSAELRGGFRTKVPGRCHMLLTWRHSGGNRGPAGIHFPGFRFSPE